ncbi:MAG: TIGR03621 family F420-dependent LLM class oxidoreductase, partial [Chloroflexi bacterium]|nr:TIGR03621 family F420-dependent LLM class oxidoreductase [Chloroflexota bacterium]
LDMLSSGRFELGIGTGYLLDDYQQAGIAFEEPKVQVDRFSEALHIIKRYFTDEVVNFAGKYYNVTNLKGSLTHVQKPYPPIYMGSGGKRMLTIAGREADIISVGPRNVSQGLNLTDSTAEPILQKLGWVREAAGERFDQLELGSMIFVMIITDHQMHAAQQVASKFGITPEQALDSLHILIGTVDQIIETLQIRRERYGISYVHAHDEHLETLAPIVSRLTGT